MKTFLVIASIAILFGLGLYFFASAIALFYTGKIGYGLFHLVLGIWMWTPPRWDPLCIFIKRLFRDKNNA